MKLTTSATELSNAELGKILGPAVPYGEIADVVEARPAPTPQTAASTKKISVLPKRSEAPARTLRSNPSASILTISGSTASLDATSWLRVIIGTVMRCVVGL